MNRLLAAASSAALLVLSTSAAAATYTLPWTGTYTEFTPFSGCDDPPSQTGPCTKVYDESGTLTITVASDADGEFFTDDVDVMTSFGWGVSDGDKIYVDLRVHDGWINYLYAFGYSTSRLSQFYVEVVQGAGNISFYNQGTHSYQDLEATIAVPEPSSAALLLAALPLAAWRRRQAKMVAGVA